MTRAVKIMLGAAMILMLVFDAWLLWQLYFWMMEHGRLW